MSSRCAPETRQGFGEGFCPRNLRPRPSCREFFMDTTANIDVSLPDFLRNLADSRLLTEPELERASSTATDDVLRLAQCLVSSGILTEYQLDVISQGRQAELRVGNYDILDRLGAGG